MKLTKPLDLDHRELKRPVLEEVTGLPAGVVEGQFWRDEVSGEPQYFDGVNSRPMGGGAGYNERGVYSAATTYNTDDEVVYLGSSWIARHDGITGITPVEGADWTLLAGKGDRGDDGFDAFTTTTANFTQPLVGALVAVIVAESGWMALGEMVWIPVGGYYTVSAIPDSTHATLLNQGFTENAAPGTVISSPKPVTPSGSLGPQGFEGEPGTLKYATLVKFGV